MEITENERIVANELITSFLKYRNSLSYANTNDTHTYSGWITDFRLLDELDQKIHLDLNNSDDLFLLFVLAVVWSRTGPWENSAFFVAHLKIHGKYNYLFWCDKANCDAEKEHNLASASKIINLVKGIDARKKISFRADIYYSVHILATNWEQIIEVLEQSARENNFNLFMDHMRNIDGLGVGNKKMLIKIPLILRELRCQNIYNNIPGAFCCVPDARVYEAAKALKIKLPISATLSGLKASSAKIYALFGDLYDLPLFAYPDLIKALSHQ
jgi:hypothetical protein